MKRLLPLLLLFCGCQKIATTHEIPAPGDSYILYNIPAGAHYCDKNNFKQVSLTEMSFKVKFDSSAIYTTVDPANQYDINKLYGFSDDSDHHQNSARIGWSWNDHALRLYAYIYSNGIRDSRELSIINIGEEVDCRIKVSGNSYIFSMKNISIAMPRTSTNAVASGYQLYPYFGGDEAAPHDVRIFICETL